MSFIRDTEIENTIREYAAPLLRVAGLEDEAFHVHVVQSPVLNAFVARGQRLFLTTGLLRRTENADQLLGVIAHEIGHIAGGHLARMHGAMEQAGTAALVTQLLGVAVAVLTGQAGAAAAVGSGGQHVAERSLLSFSRGVEQAADQAGVNFLDGAGFSSRGMLEFLDILSGQDLLRSDRQDAYVQTHPLTRDRIVFVQHHVAKSPNSGRAAPERFAQLHRRMVAKLDAFIDPPVKTLQRYSEDDKSLEARYARAIALYRYADLDEANRLTDALIREHPKDPYFHELKGQMLFENGRFEPALAAYGEAVRLLPHAPLLRTSLAHVQLETRRPELVDEALNHAKEALRVDPFVPMAWRLAGMAHDHKGEQGLAAWSLAEYNLLIGRSAQAAALAKRAMRLLKQGEPAWIRAQDILTHTENKKG